MSGVLDESAGDSTNLPKLLAHVHTFGAFPDSFVDGGDRGVALGHYRIIKTEDSPPVLVRFSHVWGVD
ncbi:MULTISPECIES: hypothetical protein [unclassified Duganella]|uniref:hypothetical protein n=1 Tax=unclassified Duganella TaxID=2636909 RepID=UPI000874DE04|nr:MULTISPECIES: hypothetical protein [unclassified Duganella]OEZ49440.1 hypothetical protein DUGA6_62940 [Duganella sp. HH105]OFA01859.1 hypothetical protein DUGA2_41920 [Duganella sp. HH101]